MVAERFARSFRARASLPAFTCGSRGRRGTPTGSGPRASRSSPGPPPCRHVDEVWPWVSRNSSPARFRALPTPEVP